MHVVLGNYLLYYDFRMERYLVCITGASGSLYALRLLSTLALQGASLHVACSDWGAHTVLEETGRPIGYWLNKIRSSGGPARTHVPVMLHETNDFAAPIASGSFRLDGTVIVPCSNETVGSLASGTASNLIHKAGSIALQEGWPLILVTQETPLSLVALRSLTALKEAGATVLPACPSFAGTPRTPEDLVDTVLATILRTLRI